MLDLTKMDSLTDQDEEYQILKEIAELIYQAKKGSRRSLSGKATMNIIKKHLENHELRIAESNATIPEKGRMNLLFLLKDNIPRKKMYELKDFNAVIKISNNAVGNSIENTPSKPVKKKFAALKKINKELKTYIIVLIENPKYKNRFTNAFTLIHRNPKVSKIIYDDINLIKDLMNKKYLVKTGNWKRVTDLLKSL